MAREIVRALGERCRRHECASDLTVGVFDTRRNHRPEQLKDVLLMNRFVPGPTFALDHINVPIFFREQVAAKVVKPSEDALVGDACPVALPQVSDVALVIAPKLLRGLARAKIPLQCSLVPLNL